MLETFAIATTNATNSVLPTTSTAMSGLVPFAGSMLAGYCIGFALKKVVKWLQDILQDVLQDIQMAFNRNRCFSRTHISSGPMDG